MFQYIARITKDCELLQYEPLLSAAPLCGEMVIHSKMFDTFGECASNATDLVTAFSKLLSQVTNEKFSAITKENPLYSGNEETAKAEGWPSNTMVRIYAAHSKKFKKENVLQFTIFVNVNVLENAPSSLTLH